MVPNTKGQERHTLTPIDVFDVENEDEDANEFDQASFNNNERFQSNHLKDREFRKDFRDYDGIDKNLRIIKIKTHYPQRFFWFNSQTILSNERLIQKLT